MLTLQNPADSEIKTASALIHDQRRTLALRSGDWAPMINSSTLQLRAILPRFRSFFAPH